uniref:Uncharacterized protein n=1 Tax=Arundo donax TaxID=35708 RepID=A0A0A9DIX9_ARUDO
MTPVPRSTSAVAGASAAGSTTTHTTGGRTSRSVCASRSSSALRRRRSPAPDRVVVTTISSRRGPASSSSSPTSTIAPPPAPAPAPASPTASGGGGARLARVLTAMREAASGSPARCRSCWAPLAFQDEVEEGAKPVKKPMTKQSEKWSSAFFHRWPPRRCLARSGAATATAPVPMDPQDAEPLRSRHTELPDQDGRARQESTNGARSRSK